MQTFPLILDVAGCEAVVLANGTFPSAEIPLRLLSQAPYVCACDGAVLRYPAANAVVGDGDSVPAEFRSRLICISEQEDNDLTKATRHCMAKGLRRIVYLGATGGREDHTIGNVSLIARYLEEFGIEPLLATDSGWFVPVRGVATFASFPGQQVSIFNLTCTHLSARGLKWEAYPYRQLWQGTLNEATGDSFDIEADGLYLIYRTYLGKS